LHALTITLARDLGPRLRAEVHGFADDGLKDLLLAVSVEWGEATQEDVQDDAAAPDVGFLAVRATEHFRGCVCECVRACVCVCVRVSN